MNEKRKLVQQLKEETLRNADQVAMKARIRILNRDIHNIFVEQRDRKERKVIADIKIVANRNRQSKVGIGPLRSGDTFESDPKRMADLLSRQYSSVFSPLKISPLMI